MENKRKRENESNKNISKKSSFKQAENNGKKLAKTIFYNEEDFIKSLKKVSGNCSSFKEDDCDSDENIHNPEKANREAVWHDEDEEITVKSAFKSHKIKLAPGGINEGTNKYSNVLKHKFMSTVGSPAWASLDKAKEDVDSDDEILKTCGHISESTTTSISKGIIEIKKVTNLNAETCSEGPYVKCVEFHPKASAALVAGISGVASLFVVDGKQNNKLHSIAFTRFPILCAKFVNNCQEMLFGSRLPFIHSYNIETSQSTRICLPYGMTHMKKFILSPDEKFIAVAGRFGEVHILEAVSKERISTFKQETEVSDLTFSLNGKHLFGHGMQGRVTVWDMNTRRIFHHWYDEGCVEGSCITCSPSGQFLATGSYQGAVNIYETKQLYSSEAPIPIKTILNLTTPISSLQFNSTSELLAFSSNSTENAVKLCHIGSKTVYSNFPNLRSPVNLVQTISFSPNSGYLAIGNNKSTVHLYRLKHYDNY